MSDPFVSTSVYRAVLNRDTPKESVASSERNFCNYCSAMLWLYDETWCVSLSFSFSVGLDLMSSSPAHIETGPTYFIRLPLQSIPLHSRLQNNWCVRSLPPT